MNPFGRRQREIQFLTFIIPSLLVAAFYVWVYTAAPFSETANLLTLNAVTILIAASAAVLLSLVTGFFERDEPARKIWLMFAIAIWFWVAGEITWGYFNVTIQEVPLLSMADWFWATGYIFLTWSILKQFQVVYPQHIGRSRITALAVWAFMLGLTTWIVLVNEPQDFWVDFLAFFYPTGDFFIGLAALVLILLFRRGQLALPWMSLFLFVVADALYLWATTSGNYAYNTSQDLLNLMVDSIYLLAYLGLAWGSLAQYLLLKHGR